MNTYKPDSRVSGACFQDDVHMLFRRPCLRCLSGIVMYFMRFFLRNSLFNHHLWSFHMTFYNPHFHHSLKSLLCDALSFLGHPRPFPSPSPTSPQLSSHRFSFPLLPWPRPPRWSACASPQTVNQVDRESGMLPTNFVNGAWNLLASATTRSRDVMRSTQMGQLNDCLCRRSSGRWFFPCHCFYLCYSPKDCTVTPNYFISTRKWCSFS